MPWANPGGLDQLRDHWRSNPYIPEWKKDSMNALIDIIQRKAADNHGSLKSIQLYYPEDCREYDVFISVANVLDALVIPTSGDGLIMRDIGEYRDFE